MLALTLFASACGSSDSSSEILADLSGSESSVQTESADRSDAGDFAGNAVGAPESEPAQAFDAEDTSADAFDDAEAMEEAAMEEEAMEEGAMEEDVARFEALPSGDAGATIAPAPAEQAKQDATERLGNDSGEGLFEDESQPDVEAPFAPDTRFADYGYRSFIPADVDPFSTFALDVDTGSYTVARRWLEEGVLPPPEAVRVEEFVNAFDYDYDTPRRGLEISVDGGPSPFDADRWLVRVGVEAESIVDGERPPVALTFVIDTSGSMDRDDRLGLVKESLEILVGELEDDDTVAIVVYSDESGVVLEPTPVRDRRTILRAIDSLRSGGSTNLESGLREGYDLAREAFRTDGVNRVIIASDGVANAGITDIDRLGRIIRDDADNGIQLLTIGYGMGSFNDTLMEQLADNGDGFYAYIDTKDEAERLFEDELTSTLITAAIDAKIQVEFDPAVVSEYRLIGFENRAVRDSDFRNDSVDAGELGAGHQVTAMYEVRLHDAANLDQPGDIGEVFLRWEDPEDGNVIEIDEDIDFRDVSPRWADTAEDFKLATVVTAFADVMRNNPYADDVNLDNIAVEAERVADEIDTDEVDALVELIERAIDLRG